MDGHLACLVVAEHMIEALLHVFSLFVVEATVSVLIICDRIEILRAAEAAAEGECTLVGVIVCNRVCTEAKRAVRTSSAISLRLVASAIHCIIMADLSNHTIYESS